jgi:hypothetical protein
MAAPPIKASLSSTSNPQRLQRAASTFLVALVISGPIPSPGRSVIEYVFFLETASSDDKERMVLEWRAWKANARDACGKSKANEINRIIVAGIR